MVYIFNNHGLRRIQYLSTFGAIKANSFKFNDDIFLIITNSVSRSTTYLWVGQFFVEWKQFNQFEKNHKSSVEIVENQPLFFAINTRSILVYKLHPAEYEILSKFRFKNRLSKILSYQVVKSDDFTFLFLSAMNSFNKSEIYFIPFSVYYLKTEEPNNSESYSNQYNEQVFNCFTATFEYLKHQKQIVDEVWNITQKIFEQKMYYRRMTPTETESKLEYNSKKTVPDNVQKYSLPSNFENIEDEIKLAMQKVQILPQISQKILFRGTLRAEIINVNFLETQNLNDKKWNSSKWFFNNRTQKIPIIYPNHVIVTRNLDILDDKVSSRMSTENGPKYSNSITVNSLIANNIQVKRINDIDFGNMCFNNNKDKIVNQKEFTKIEAETLNLDEPKANNLFYQINNLDNSEDRIELENLYVENINKMEWKNFTNSLLLKNVHNVIRGNVKINSNMVIKKLLLNSLHDIDVNKILTSSTDQTISSDFQLFNVNVDNIISDNINGIDFSQQIATSGSDRIVKGPVSVKKITVLGTLNLAQEIRVDENLINDHDFYQFYKGDVKIIGNVLINNLNIDQSCSVYHKNKKINLSLADRYWMKNTEQIIHFGLSFKNISTAFLNTFTINGASLDLYVKSTDSKVHFRNLIIQKLVVHGNFSTNLTIQDISYVNKLLKETVKKTGTFLIGGHKVYANTLKIDRLNSNFINSEKINNSTNFHNFDNVNVPGHYTTVIIKKNMYVHEDNKAYIQHVNDVNLKDLFTNTLYKNQNFSLDYFYAKNLSTNGVIFNNLNDVNVEEILINATDLYDKENVHKMIFKGNIKMHNTSAKIMNSVTVNEYFSQVVFLNSKYTLDTSIKFLEKPIIKSMYANTINDIKIKDIEQNYLSRSKMQAIRSIYDFNKIVGKQIISSALNEISVNNLISKQNDKIYVNGTLYINKIHTNNHITSSTFNCDIQNAANILRRPKFRNWPHITASSINLVENTGIFSDITFYEIHKTIVRPIIGVAILDHLEVTNIELSKPLINDINFIDIFEDTVTKHGHNQIITGKKTFKMLFAPNAKLLTNGIIDSVNNIDILDLNMSLISKHNSNNLIIHGNKVFNNRLYMKNVETSLPVQTVKPNNLVTFSNADSLPNSHFTNLTIINNLDFDTFNNIAFEIITKNRLLINSQDVQYVLGSVIFDHVSIFENSYISSINELKVDEMVVDEGIQNITGYKRFTEPTKITRNLNVHLLNGYDITKSYESAARLGDRPIKLANNIIFEKSTELSKDLAVPKINNIDIKYLNNLLNSNELFTEIRNAIISSKLRELSEELRVLYADHKEYLYIEKIYSLGISVPNSMNAHVIQIENNTQLNIVGQKMGSECGLPSECFCPAQYSLQISPYFSYEIILSGESQRVFGFYKDGFSANLVTKSISKSHTCR